MTKESIESQLPGFRSDYELFAGSPCNYFVCPILGIDETTDLCLGHVINEKLPNCSRRSVLQRKDVDGFYGSVVEKHFVAATLADNPTAHDVVMSDKLSRQIPWWVSIDGQTVPHYVIKDSHASEHTVVELQDSQGKTKRIALKISDTEFKCAKHMNVCVDRDYIPEATAALLKSAHLTLFRLLGYNYAFGTAGLMVADILKKFYLAYHNADRKKQEKAIAEYFLPHAGMVAPLERFDESIYRGSVDDNRYLFCVGSSGKPYSIVVMVRINKAMHLVFLPWDDASNMDIYFSLISNPRRKQFQYLLAEFEVNGPDGPRWKVDPEVVVFNHRQQE